MQSNDMKLPAILLSTLFIAAPAYAGGPATGGARVFPESHCYRNTEEYVPGYYDSRGQYVGGYICLLYTSPSPRDKRQSRMPSSA